jgi:putative flippase GtrA
MEIRRQFLTFAIVGIASNAALYAAYLAVTALGVGHKTAMTLLFATGVLCTYLFNRRWTFRHGGGMRQSALRYVGAYLFACLGNVAVLFWLVDVAHFPHRIVTLGLIVATACLTFVLQKFWVFSEPATGSVGPHESVREL